MGMIGLTEAQAREAMQEGKRVRFRAGGSYYEGFITGQNRGTHRFFVMGTKVGKPSETIDHRANSFDFSLVEE